jgi:hypothetical protein
MLPVHDEFFFYKNGYEIILKDVAEPLVQITKCPLFLWAFNLENITAYNCQKPKYILIYLFRAMATIARLLETCYRDS